jgi:hypothetical protein
MEEKKPSLPDPTAERVTLDPIKLTAIEVNRLAAAERRVMEIGAGIRALEKDLVHQRKTLDLAVAKSGAILYQILSGVFADPQEEMDRVWKVEEKGEDVFLVGHEDGEVPAQ